MIGSMKKNFKMATLLLLGLAQASQAETTLTIEGWGSGDDQIWKEKIFSAFEAENPGIVVKIRSSDGTGFDEYIEDALSNTGAGDLIMCRPFDVSLSLFQSGYLVDLTDKIDLSNFEPHALSAWTTDDGKSHFCLPIASVIHGFIYNKEIFDELGLAIPQSVPDFFYLLRQVREKSDYLPLAIGTRDKWEAATMGYNNIGPNAWKGEDGRLAIIRGQEKLTDENWIEPFRQLSEWRQFMGSDFSNRGYNDSRGLFTGGEAAVFPAGSWDIANFILQADFEMGAFKPPLIEGSEECYISDHPDLAIGVNANTKQKGAALKLLDWMTTREFATLYSNAFPGFFSLSNHPTTLDEPISREFESWRNDCRSTIRSSYQILSRGDPSLEELLWQASVDAIEGNASAKTLGKRLQGSLESWYEPQLND